MENDSPPHLSSNLHFNSEIKMPKRKSRSIMGLLNTLQFYPVAMSESAIFSRKYCEKAAKVHRSPKCPEDFPHFWKGNCFKVMDGWH